MKGSAEAFKAANGGENPMKQLNKTAEQQLAAQEETNDLLAQVVDDSAEVVEL